MDLFSHLNDAWVLAIIAGAFGFLGSAAKTLLGAQLARWRGKAADVANWETGYDRLTAKLLTLENDQEDLRNQIRARDYAIGRQPYSVAQKYYADVATWLARKGGGT